MMPHLNDYRDSIENLITEQSGIKLTIGQVDGSWESIGPVLELHNVQFEHLSNEKSEQKSFVKSIKIHVSPFPSIFYRTLITDKLTIEGLSLSFEQEQTGEFKFTKLSTTADKNTDINSNLAASIQDWLQYQKELLFYQTHINISLRNGHKYPINIDEVHFEKGKDIYQLTGHSKLSGKNQIDFVFEVDGFLSDPTAQGKLYIDTHQINMPEIPLNAVWNETNILSGFLELKLWADWKNNHFESALISLSIDDFLLSLLGEPQTHLNKFSSYLVWQRLSDGWIFESQQSDILSQGRVWPDPSLSIKMNQKENENTFNISASRLDLGIWVDLIMANPNLDTDIRKQLLSMNPNGYIDDIIVTTSMNNNKLIDLRANAHFSELTWQPWKKIPGVKNFSGQFEIHEDNGKIIFDSRNAKIDYPGLFRWPFNVDVINSQLSWNISDEIISIELNKLLLDVYDAQLMADGLFTIHRKSKLLDMNVYAELDNGNVAKTSTFLPFKIMKENLVNYLDDSIKSGSLHSTQIAIRGPATSFPFPNPEGVFAINAKVSDTHFSFSKDWPELEQISADLWFVENSMDISITKGKSNGQTITSAAAIIENLKSKPTMLIVKTTSNGNVEDGINYLNNSPLKDSVGKIFDVIPTKGPFDLKLDLKIPLATKINVHVDGEVNLLGNSMIVAPIDMAVDNIYGKISISDSLVFSDKLSADIMGGISQYKLHQNQDAEGILLTTISGTGTLTTEGLRNVFPTWIPTLLEGETEYNLNMLLPHQVKPSTDYSSATTISADSQLKMALTVDSDLKGITSQFLPPFDKSAEQLESFTLNYKLLQNNQQLFAASISDRADMKFLKAQHATSGNIVFGGDKASTPEYEGIELSGEFNSFDLESWLNLLQKQTKLDMEMLEISDYSYLRVKNLLIKDLKYYFLNFNDVTVSATEKNNSFHFDLKGDEIAGLVQVPDTELKLPIEINLTSLTISDQFPLLETENNPFFTSKVPETQIVSHSKPLPTIKIHCEKCIYNQQQLGSTTINVNPVENGNKFTVMMATTDILNLDLKGDWHRNENNDVVTNISGNVNTNKIGNLMRLFNTRTGIRGTKLDLNGELNWRGDPSQFNFQTLNGSLLAKGGKGSQEDISDKGARFFSIFSVGSLARKLTLDFSDLFGNGFFYTGLEGNFAVNNGAFNTNDFEIDGTSADVEIKGVTDFTNNSIEKCIRVTPELSSSLPVLAGWAIEPVTGLVVYLMSKLFQPALKVVTSILYKIEGPIDNPIVTEIRKTAGTAIVDNSIEEGKTTITQDTELPKFTCDEAFKK